MQSIRRFQHRSSPRAERRRVTRSEGTSMEFDRLGSGTERRGQRSRMRVARCLGGWQGEAPVAFRAGDANLFRYAFNGPTDATDPDGEAAPHPNLESVNEDRTVTIDMRNVFGPKGGKNGAYAWAVNWEVSPK